jgi:NADH dehydrogenase
MKSTLFITGATGFIGSHLLARLDPRGFETVFCLSRRGANAAAPAAHHNVRLVAGDLFDAAAYASALASADTVLHLAAATGNAPASEHFRVNAQGTRFLVEQSRRLGVQRFLYVSTIAVRFADLRHYPYAQSKREGEAAVRGSGLPYTIVRPTIVLGRGSPIGRRLHALASGAVTPIIGRGSVRIQPIDVDDLADCLLSIMVSQRFDNEVLELGGPDVLSMLSLLTRIHQRRYQRAPRVLHLPFRPLRSALALAERLPIRLPVSAGQLAPFANDGVAQSNDLARGQPSAMKGIDEMIQQLASDA